MKYLKLKKAPKTRGRKKLISEFTIISPEKSSKWEALRVLNYLELTECPEADGWKQVDCIIENLPQGTWRIRARYGQYKY